MKLFSKIAFVALAMGGCDMDRGSSAARGVANDRGSYRDVSERSVKEQRELSDREAITGRAGQLTDTSRAGQTAGDGAANGTTRGASDFSDRDLTGEEMAVGKKGPSVMTGPTGTTGGTGLRK